MLPNTPNTKVLCKMSYPNPSVHARKKVSKRPSNISCNSNKSSKTPSLASNSSNGNKDDELVRVKSSASHCTKITADYGKLPDQNDRKVDKTISSANFTRKLWNNPGRTYERSPSSYKTQNGIIEEESDLISLMTKQLYLAESQMQKMQGVLTKAEEQLHLKDQEISRLKRKVQDWEIKNKNQEIQRKKEQQQHRTQADNSEYLYRRCLALEHKIYEMEKFLSDYGLTWVGDANASMHSDAISNNYIETCYDLLAANVDQLNLAAGKGEVCVHHNENGASFKTPSCLSLKFYKNGMIMRDGPLRPYSDPKTMSFIRDILDGYFPSELQQTHPNGVPFKIEDHRKEMYMGAAGTFPGQGYRLGKQSLASESFLSTTNSHKSDSNSQSSHPQSGRYSPVLKNCGEEANVPTVASAIRSLKPKPSAEVPLLNITSLRSQILASHNNICSDTHIQSHINAELGLSSRREKRDVATKNTEIDGAFQERVSRSKPLTRSLSSRKSFKPRSVDRLLAKLSSSRGDISDRTRPRSRSATLSGNRFTVSSRSSGKSSSIASTEQKNSVYSTRSSTSKTSEATVTGVSKKAAPPILYQVNEPNEGSGELRLKVRSLNGGTVYLVHVSADESISKLYELLDRTMPKTRSKKYKIVISGYSPRRLDQLNMSLRESGITRDSVLHLVND